MLMLSKRASLSLFVLENMLGAETELFPGGPRGGKSIRGAVVGLTKLDGGGDCTTDRRTSDRELALELELRPEGILLE
jgi:hypothetical protein